MKFEYVFSALNMMKIGGAFSKIQDYEKFKKLVEHAVREVTSKYEFASIGLLYNAMTESSHGEHIYKFDLPTYVDSGGLQLAILGLDPAKVEDKKKDIFETQAKHGNYGFIFDEMPIIIDNTNNVTSDNNRVDNSSRIFLHDMVLSSATKTADNVRRHIDTFIQHDSDAQIFIIGQGNNFETFNRYLSTIAHSLDDDHLKYVRGIAPSDTCYGMGQQERWDLMFQIKDYDIPESMKKNVHLLGVGAVSGFTPVLLAPEYFSFLETLSFDSSSHSRKFQIDGRWGSDKKLPKNNRDKLRSEYKKMYQYSEKYMKACGIVDFDDFIERCSYLSSKNVDDVWSYDDGTEIGRMAYVLLNLLGNIQHVDRIFQNIQNFKHKFPFQLRDYQDFVEHRKAINRKYRLSSMKVRDFQSLDHYNQEKAVSNIILDLF